MSITAIVTEKSFLQISTILKVHETFKKFNKKSYNWRTTVRSV